MKKSRFAVRAAATVMALFLILGMLSGCSDDKKSEQNNKKKIAFTFDDGPHAPVEDINEYVYSTTPKILDKLENLGMKATFFIVGDRLVGNSRNIDAMKRAQTLGCEIGWHTYSHTPLKNDGVADSDDEVRAKIQKCANTFASTGLNQPKLFRAPGGRATEEQLQVIASLGYNTIYWSVDTEDWKNNPKSSAKYSDDAEVKAAYEQFVNDKVEYIAATVKEGDIILMHDIFNSSVDIFCRVADRLVADGYEFVTVSELLGFDGSQQPKAVMYESKSEYITHAS